MGMCEKNRVLLVVNDTKPVVNFSSRIIIKYLDGSGERTCKYYSLIDELNNESWKISMVKY